MKYALVINNLFYSDVKFKWLLESAAPSFSIGTIKIDEHPFYFMLTRFDIFWNREFLFYRF